MMFFFPFLNEELNKKNRVVFVEVDVWPHQCIYPRHPVIAPEVNGV